MDSFKCTVSVNKVIAYMETCLILIHVLGFRTDYLSVKYRSP